jgi:hypothetical protein
VGALLRRERPLYRAMKVLRPVESGDFAQTCAFCFQALFDFLIILNIYEMRRHIFLRRCVAMLILI